MSNTNTDEQLDFAFGKKNYILMIAGILMLLLGFVLLSGGGSQDPKVFSEAIFNTQRMVIAPLFMLGGFVVEVFAIMYRPKVAA